MRTAIPIALAASLLSLATPAAQAQMGSGDGFLFRTPTWRLALSGGFSQPRGRSDIFDFVTRELTLDRGDFAAATFTGSVLGRVAPRVDLGVMAGYAGRRATSESRDFEGEDDLPIVQNTALHRVPLMAVGRVLLASPGRSVGRYAWIPSRVVPFVGGGAGAVWYRLQQDGEFVDRQTLDIFEEQFESTGWSVGGTALGGADVTLTPRIGMTAEGRYLWARAPMKGDFGTFNKIDLSGYEASIGFFVRF